MREVEGEVVMVEEEEKEGSKVGNGVYMVRMQQLSELR